MLVVSIKLFFCMKKWLETLQFHSYINKQTNKQTNKKPFVFISYRRKRFRADQFHIAHKTLFLSETSPINITGTHSLKRYVVPWLTIVIIRIHYALLFECGLNVKGTHHFVLSTAVPVLIIFYQDRTSKCMVALWYTKDFSLEKAQNPLSV